MSRIWMLFAALCVGLVLLMRGLPQTGAAPVVGPPVPSVTADAQIRQYILDHPEVLIQSVNGMNAREAGKALQNLRTELETPFPGAIAGNPNGDVTLVEFFDFRCPYCHTAHAEIAKVIAADSNVRVVYRDLPILDAPGRELLSRRAAQLALAAAKQGKYKAFYDRVFATPGRLTVESLIAAARAVGLDERRAARDAESEDVRIAIQRNLKLASSIGIDGTPGFVIGDELHAGAKSASDLLAAIARVRARDSQARSRSSAG